MGVIIDSSQRERVGFSCKKGLKPEAPNQDSFFIVRAGDDLSIYGVFDGHGPSGHDVSDFVKNELFARRALAVFNRLASVVRQKYWFSPRFPHDGRRDARLRRFDHAPISVKERITKQA